MAVARRPFWCIWWDPFGLICLLVGLATVCLVNYVTVARIIWPWFGASFWGMLHAGVFQTMIVLILTSYVRASTSDPGSVDMNTADASAAPRSDDPDSAFKVPRRFCKKCQCWKPPRAHHCSTCGRCIVKMDHHCPWVNNCVGTNNMRFFLQFLGHTFAGSLYALVLALARFGLLYARCGGLAAFGLGAAAARLHGVGGGRMPPHIRAQLGISAASAQWCSAAAGAPYSVVDAVLLVLSTVLAIFFAIFTAAMAFDQVEGMTTNTTAIESMQGWAEEDRSLAEGLTDYCGSPPGIAWVIPSALPPSSPAYFNGAVLNPDAYDPRDPVTARHFQRIEMAIAAGRGLGGGGSSKDAGTQSGAAASAAAPSSAGDAHRRRSPSDAAHSDYGGSDEDAAASPSSEVGSGVHFGTVAAGYAVDEGEAGRDPVLAPGCARPPHGLTSGAAPTTVTPAPASAANDDPDAAVVAAHADGPRHRKGKRRQAA